MLTREQIQKNIQALEQQGASQQDVQSWLDSLKSQTSTQQAITEQPKQENLLQKIGNFTIGTKNTAENIASVISAPKEVQRQQEQVKTQVSTTDDILKAAQELKAQGKTEESNKLLQEYIDSLDQSSQRIGTEQLAKVAPATTKTKTQILGDVAGLGVDLLGGGSLATKGAGIAMPILSKIPGAEKVLSQVPQILNKPGALSGALKGAAQGAMSGLGFGAAAGASKAMQADEDLGGIFAGSALGGGMGAATGGILGGILGGISGKIMRDQEVTKLLQEKRQPAEVIQYVKGDKGIKIDKVTKNALDKGIEATDVQFIKNASAEDKKIFQKMYSVAQKASKDKLYNERPFYEAGKTILNEAKYVDKQNKIIGTKLGQVVRNMPKQKIDITPIKQNFINDLAEQGIKVNSKGKLNFKNSAFADMPTVQKQLQLAYSKIKAGSKTPQEIEIIRQSIFNNLDLAKRDNKIIPQAQTIIEKMRSELRKPLVEISSEYDALSKQFAQSKYVLNRFNKLMGKDFNLSRNASEIRSGEIGRRLLSNASAQTDDILTGISNLSEEFGMKKTTNIRNQILFADFVEDLFGTQPRTGLAGQMKQGVGGVSGAVKEGVGVAENVAKGNILGLVDAGGKMLTGALQKTPKQQQEAVLKLILNK